MIKLISLRKTNKFQVLSFVTVINIQKNQLAYFKNMQKLHGRFNAIYALKIKIIKYVCD